MTNREATHKLIEEAPEPARRQLATMLALNQANRFEYSMRRVSRAVGLTPGQLAKLEARVMELANDH